MMWAMEDGVASCQKRMMGNLKARKAVLGVQRRAGPRTWPTAGGNSVDDDEGEKEEAWEADGQGAGKIALQPVWNTCSAEIPEPYSSCYYRSSLLPSIRRYLGRYLLLVLGKLRFEA